MKSWYRRGTALAVLCAVGLAVVMMAQLYFRYVSEKIYEECADHLVEVYSQVNHNFVSFLEKNWGSLDDWVHHIQIEDEEGVLTFLHGRQEYWKFSQFYFLSSDGQGFTPEGTVEQFSDENALDALFHQHERTMFMETLSSGQAVTLFAIPVEGGSYRGLDYDAIAVSYSNADIVASLDANAFSNQSMCLVVYTDGSVLLSTQQSGSAFGNYLSYLNAGSDLDPEKLAEIQQDWEKGVSGVVRCEIGGVSHFISYLPVGYESCILLGIVPESAASANMLEVQKATVDVLTKVSVLLGALIVVWIVLSYRQKTKKSYLELRYRERMFDMLSNNVDDVFLMLDSKTFKVDYLSPNVEKLLGIPQDRILENVHLLEESSVGESSGFTTMEKLKSIPIHGSQYWEREHVHQTTGERRWFYETVYRENIQGVEKFVVVMSDRTRERNMSRKLEEALAAAKSANKAKSNFLSNMSHDIRTPMNAIVGFAVLLAREAGNEEKVREYTRKISTSSQHLLSLINDVLDMSKIESGKTSLNVAVFHLPELMEELYAILLPQARAKHQFFEFRTKGCPAERLLGDKLRLNQILINLLSNAIKYTQEGGEVTCTVEELPQTSSQFSKLRFVVADNGMGMSEEFVKTVFEPFSREIGSTSGIQGTGLGMAITKNLVELMGGIITVTSQQGEGSVFSVDLSFALPEPDEEEDFWVSRKISRILIVDDEEEICLDVQAMMQETGVDVSYETRGIAAVKTVIQAREKKEDFHAILLDCIMPGQNGVETARQIRKEVGKGVPILMLTSYDWSDIEEDARAAGVDAFIPKPFFVSTFQQALEGLYAKRKKEEAPPDTENVLHGLRLLVAEDNELNAEILFELMDIEGARCELAVNGQEAVEIFLHSEPDHYDMILMDVQMPVMNGYEATREIRACSHPRAKSIPIVAMTANAFAEDVQNALDAGMNGHLTKPIDMDIVRVLLGRLRSEQNPQAAALPKKENEGSTGK